MSKFKVSINIEAESKEQAHTALGMLVRTDASMKTLADFPYTEKCRVDWESLRSEEVDDRETYREGEVVKSPFVQVSEMREDGSAQLTIGTRYSICVMCTDIDAETLASWYRTEKNA